MVCYERLSQLVDLGLLFSAVADERQSGACGTGSFRLIVAFTSCFACNWQVKELVEELTQAQCSLDKCSREKMSITAELEVARSQLNSVDVDYGKVPALLFVIYCDIVGHLAFSVTASNFCWQHLNAFIKYKLHKTTTGVIKIKVKVWTLAIAPLT